MAFCNSYTDSCLQIKKKGRNFFILIFMLDTLKLIVTIVMNFAKWFQLDLFLGSLLTL